MLPRRDVTVYDTMYCSKNSTLGGTPQLNDNTVEVFTPAVGGMGTRGGGAIVYGREMYGVTSMYHT